MPNATPRQQRQKGLRRVGWGLSMRESVGTEGEEKDSEDIQIEDCF